MNKAGSTHGQRVCAPPKETHHHPAHSSLCECRFMQRRFTGTFPHSPSSHAESLQNMERPLPDILLASCSSCVHLHENKSAALRPRRKSFAELASCVGRFLDHDSCDLVKGPARYPRFSKRHVRCSSPLEQNQQNQTTEDIMKQTLQKKNKPKERLLSQKGQTSSHYHSIGGGGGYLEDQFLQGTLCQVPCL